MDILNENLQETNNENLPTIEEEMELVHRIQKGDEKAKEQLINAYSRLVESVARQYQDKGLSWPELINEGNSGLIKAAHQFDEARSFKFSAYAVWWMRQSIEQAVGEQNKTE